MFGAELEAVVSRVLGAGVQEEDLPAAFLLVDRPQYEGLAVAKVEQPAAGAEWRAAQAICTHYNVPLRRLVVTPEREIAHGEVFGRNLMLIATCLLGAQRGHTAVAIGIHAGTGYADCSPGFLRAVNAVVSDMGGKRVEIRAPWVDMTKSGIADYCIKVGVPLHLTHSCERGDVPCGACLSCRDQEALRARPV